MATITFYQKPGCKTNARQKQLLEAAGHIVTAKSLLTEPWTDERLCGFFGSTSVASWFNPAAPRIKSGEIDPAAFAARAAPRTPMPKAAADPVRHRAVRILTQRRNRLADERCSGIGSAPRRNCLGL